VQYANRRGISDEELAAASKEQGDLLDVFEELAPGDLTPVDQRSAARQAGVPEQLRLEVAELLGLENPDEGTQADADALALLGPALQLGLPAEAMSQLVRVYVELLERLADAENRIFHDHVHEQFRAAGLSGRALLEATNAVAKPALELVESAVLYFHRRGWDKASRDDFLRHLAEASTPPRPHPGEHTAAVLFVDLAGFTRLPSQSATTGLPTCSTGSPRSCAAARSRTAGGSSSRSGTRSCWSSITPTTPSSSAWMR
jgi:adenylate cyclase